MKKTIFKIAISLMASMLLPIQAVQNLLCGFIIGRHLTKGMDQHFD